MTGQQITAGSVAGCQDVVLALASARGLLSRWTVTTWLAVGLGVCCAGLAGWLLGAGGLKAPRRVRQPSWAGVTAPGVSSARRGPLAARRAGAVLAGHGGLVGAVRARVGGEGALSAFGDVPAAGFDGGRRSPVAPGALAGRDRSPGASPWRRGRACDGIGVLRRSWVWRAVCCLTAGAVVAVLGGSVLPLLLGLAALPVVRRAARAEEARRTRDQRADAVITLCGTLAGEVRAGRHPGEALLAVACDADGPAVAQAAVLAAARFGGDVPAALAGAARRPGAEGLLGLAACWRVAVDSGASLATGLERLEGALRAEREQRADLRAQLAGARTTAVLLAWLPVLGLLLGTALGAHPLHVLLHSAAGLGCLAVGGALEGAGLWWALRIVRTGESG